MSVTVPNQTVAIAEPGGLPTPDFRRWQLAITSAVNTPVDSTPVEPVSGDFLPLSTFVNGVDGITFYGSLATGGVSLGLETLADTATGTFKLIDERDDFGRITGVADGTAADVPYDNATSGLASTDVQGALDEVSQAANISIADAGGFYTGTDVEAALQELGASGGGAGAMTIVGTATVTGSAATVLTMSGLDLATDRRYVIELAFKNATASQSSVSLYYNGDTTAANYDAQFMTIDGATTTPLRVGSGLVFSVPASSVINSEMKIRHDLDGRARALITSNRGDATTLLLQNVAHAYETVANVTSITFSGSVANALAVGSYFKVWKIA